MILLAHPFGNENVRAILSALEQEGLLAKFITTLGWSNRLLSFTEISPRLRSQLERRAYDLPADRIRNLPFRESIRLLAQRTGQNSLIEHERGWASIDRVWREVDKWAAEFLRQVYQLQRISAVYCYEDCAEQSFQIAQRLGVRRVYDLPIAYWQTLQRLLQEEEVRHPDWGPTLSGRRDSPEKLARKTRELELAELVICPSDFVLESLPEPMRSSKVCVVVPFGSPSVDGRALVSSKPPVERALRILFAGTLTQRKGLADVFEAIKLVDSAEIELVVMGSLLQPLEWYRERLPRFTYEPPRPHQEVLKLMRTCDVLVLPSIVEGRALVQQEAMACGLPLIVTRNAGGHDLVIEGETGFVVPIRAPEAIAEKMDWFAANRSKLAGMAIASQERASQFTWQGYGETVIAAIRSLSGA